MVYVCPGLIWGRDNDLPNSWYSAVLWLWSEKNADNIPAF